MTKDEKLVLLLSAANSLIGFVRGKYDIDDGVQFECPYFKRLEEACACVVSSKTSEKSHPVQVTPLSEPNQPPRHRRG